MKITKKQLKQIIKEELEGVLSEQDRAPEAWEYAQGLVPSYLGKASRGELASKEGLASTISAGEKKGAYAELRAAKKALRDASRASRRKRKELGIKSIYGLAKPGAADYNERGGPERSAYRQAYKRLKAAKRRYYGKHVGPKKGMTARARKIARQQVRNRMAGQAVHEPAGRGELGAVHASKGELSNRQIRYLKGLVKKYSAKLETTTDPQQKQEFQKLVNDARSAIKSRKGSLKDFRKRASRFGTFGAKAADRGDVVTRQGKAEIEKIDQQIEQARGALWRLKSKETPAESDEMQKDAIKKRAAELMKQRQALVKKYKKQ
jgi:hypothetical protein